MTEPSPRTGGRRGLVWKIGFYVVTIGGTVANGIQVLSAGTVTPAGLLIAGLIGAVALLPAVYQEGHERGARSLAGSDPSGTDQAVHSRELAALKSILDSTLGAYQPHRDRRTIVLDIGDRPEDDTIEERRRTTPSQGPVVYWSQFEALTLAQNHILGWDDIALRVDRMPEDDDDPQRAKVVPVRDWPIPRALILFAPPRREVAWTAHYRSPGYWDQLRSAGGQWFTWAPPLVRRDENGGQRTPVQNVTFIFRVPSAMGLLDRHPLPDGIVLEGDDHPRDGVRTYKFIIGDLNGFLAKNHVTDTAIRIFLGLSPGGAR